jgi:hypothetical protein
MPEIKSDAAQTGPAQTVTTQTAIGITGAVLQADMHSPLKNVQVTATRGARPENSDESEDGSAADRNSAQRRMRKAISSLPNFFRALITSVLHPHEQY